MQVEWEDGLSAKVFTLPFTLTIRKKNFKFHNVWLADNSKRKPSLIHLDLDVRPESLDISPSRFIHFLYIKYYRPTQLDWEVDLNLPFIYVFAYTQK